MKEKEFRTMQYARLGKRNREEAEEEASNSYEFKMLVYEFVRKQTVSFQKTALLENACYVNEKTWELDFRISDFMNYLRSIKSNKKLKEVTFDLRHVLNATKKNGDVINPITDKKKSCPTWRFKSDPDQYQVMGDSVKQVEHEKN